MDTVTATAARTAASRPPGWRLHRYEWGLAAVGSAACLVATVLLSAEGIAGGGASGLAVLAFALVAVWCFVEPRTERTLVVFALYVGLLDGYLKLRTGDQLITLGRDLLLWSVALGALWRASARGNLAMPPFGGIVLAFCAVVIVEVANPSGPGIAEGLAGVRQHLEFVPLFFLGYAVIRSNSRLRAVMVVLVVCASANGVVSYLQSTISPAQLAGWGSGYRERIEGKGVFRGSGRVAFDQTGKSHVRPFGLGSEIGSGAVAAALALPALAVLLFSTYGWRRLLIFLLGIGVALGVTTSGSRAALVACFVSLAAFGLIAAASRNAFRTIAALVVGATILYVVFLEVGGHSDSSRRAETITPSKAIGTFSKERGDSVGKISDYVVSYPLGVGVGTVGPAAGASGLVLTTSKELDAETEWNLLVLEIGIVGMLIVIVIGIRLLALIFLRIRRFEDSSLRFNLAALGAPVVAMFAAAFAGPVSVSAPSAPYLWLITGVFAYWLVTAYGESSET